ncbi:MAG: hypothetical protein ACRCTE_12065, partial [Cellulosilyticaceae bacterium]
SLYVVNERTDIEEPVAGELVEWEEMKSGMLMQTLLTLKGGRFEDLAQKTFRPVNLAYTYLYYKGRKIEGGDIAFEITPYQINGPVTYQLHYQEAGAGSNWVAGPSVYYPNGSSKDKKLTLTTKAANTSYKITVTTGGKDNETYTYDSQILKYDPSGEATPPPLPEIISIENVYVVPDSKAPQVEQPPAIGFDLNFRAPSTTELETFLKDKGALYYELYLHNEGRTESQLIKVFKVSMEPNSDGKEVVTIRPHAGGSDEGTYNTRKDLFSIQNVKLKHNGETGWEAITGLPEDYLNQGEYPQNLDTQHTIPYKVPGTYYLSMRAVADPQGDTARLAVSEPSNLKSFALDLVNELIPTTKYIDSVSSSVEEQIAQQIIFNHVDITKYVRYMLDPVGLELKGNPLGRTYEIYLYQDPSMNENDLKQFTELGKDAKGNFVATKEHLELLREGKHALKMEYSSNTNDANEKGNVNIVGLEPNQVYYVQIKVRLDIVGPNFEQARYSLFSKIHSFTTSTKPLPPTPDEQVPPAPDKFFVDEIINNTAVKLGWEPPTLDEQQKTEVFYEFIRSTDAEIPEKDLIREKSLLDLLKQSKHYKAFKTYAPREEKPLIHEYDGSNFVPLKNPEQLAVDLRLLDNSLAPNTVYYYYVRTVQKIQGKDVASEWIMVPVTTTPVESPIKLKVESKENYKYDPKTETVISFWAPIPPNGKVPEEYSFDIAVKGEKDDEFKLDYKVVQVKEEPVDAFYKRYVYRIEGLKPGTRYDIKVRIKDKTKLIPEGGDYPTSLFSDKVVYRTEFDDEEQEKDEAFEEYLKKYDQEAEKLKRKPYWEVGHEKYRGIYKYRESYLESELMRSNTYKLVVAENASQAYYYLPASTFKKAQKNKTILEIQLEDTVVHLRPGTLTDKNKDVMDAVGRIEDKKIKDYYIAVEILLYNTSQTIGGAKPLSPQITVDLELIYSDEEDRIVEDDIMEALVKLIDKGRLNVIDDLEREIKKGKIQDERLDAIIQEEIDNIIDKHRDRVKSIMKGVIDRDRFVSTVDQPILLTQKLKANGVEAYYSDGSWEKVYVMQTSMGYSVEANRLGTYIFTGKGTSMPTVPGIPGADDLISKYQLTDFISTRPERLDWYVTKSQAYGSVARVLGASRGVDYVEYLKQRGIKDINRIGSEQAMRQDEMLYLVMQAYEKITYKSVNQIMIMNKQSVSNISAFQPKYRQYVYAAVQLGVVTPKNQRVSPSDGVTTREFLQMLSKIITK